MNRLLKPAPLGGSPEFSLFVVGAYLFG